MTSLVDLALVPDLPAAGQQAILDGADRGTAALVAARPDVAPEVAAAAARSPVEAVRRAGLARTTDAERLAEAVGRGSEADAVAALGNPACPADRLAVAARTAPATQARVAAANPSCPEEAAEAAVARRGPTALLGRRAGARRLAWASALLAAHPALATVLATADDADVRRAVLRLPGLSLEDAGLVLSTRQSGMHTLARNPYLPLDLVGETPSKRRRRDAVLAVVGDDPDRLRRDPDPRAVEVGSGTLDLLLVDAPPLPTEVALALARRRQPPVDGWVLSVLVERVGAAAWWAARPASSSARRSAAAEHSPLAAALGALRPAASPPQDRDLGAVVAHLGDDAEAWRREVDDVGPG